jgi:hypothetical protein
MHGAVSVVRPQSPPASGPERQWSVGAESGERGGPRYADNPDPAVAEVGSPHARYAMVTRRGTAWTMDLLVLSYDWSRVVERARATGHEYWLRGFLRTSGGPAA